MQTFQQYEASLHQPIEPDFKIPNLKLGIVELKKFGDRTPEEQMIYDYVYRAQSVEELKTIPIFKAYYDYIYYDNNLYAAAFQAAVASGDLEKFKYVLSRHVNSDRSYTKLINYMIFSAAHAELEEYKLMELVEYYFKKIFKENWGVTDLIRGLIEYWYGEVEEKIWSSYSISEYAVGYAVEDEFYQVANFLLKQGVKINNLTLLSLFSVTEQDKDTFETFKWLYLHGAKVDSKLLGNLICYDGLSWGFYKSKFHNNPENIEKSLNLLKDLGATNQEEIDFIKDRCEIIENIFERFAKLDYYLKAKAPLETVKFAFDNGADIETGWVIEEIINYPYADVVDFVLDIAKERDLEYRDEHKIEGYLNRHMDNCDSNLAIAKYFKVENSHAIKWDNCGEEWLNEHPELAHFGDEL